MSREFTAMQVMQQMLSDAFSDDGNPDEEAEDVSEEEDYEASNQPNREDEEEEEGKEEEMPAKYGIKTWEACDSKSSYAWKMQVYTGKAAATDTAAAAVGGGAGGRGQGEDPGPRAGHGPEKNLGMQVVLDVMEGLRDRNVTCDNFFTSYELGQQLLKRKMTMVGTV
ncbi:piggyBac transposable element-derived protein 4-like [Xyrichtys novacula]|uniref:PiggyBac transposable element-derived protein 4-like n=1 Tax=Xyrichtys novacula TaxID=13765 RepID=A0AAV1H7G6_XYRNO|nr:piggyBac transposable element-derived protein 4-like [Xyrichtys novacula]